MPFYKESTYPPTPPNVTPPSHGGDVAIVGAEEQVDDLGRLSLERAAPGIDLLLRVFEVVVVVEVKLGHQSLQGQRYCISPRILEFA